MTYGLNTTNIVSGESLLSMDGSSQGEIGEIICRLKTLFLFFFEDQTAGRCTLLDPQKVQNSSVEHRR